MSIDWTAARSTAHAAGRAAAGASRTVALIEADGLTLAEPLLALTDLPALLTTAQRSGCSAPIRAVTALTCTGSARSAG